MTIDNTIEDNKEFKEEININATSDIKDKNFEQMFKNQIYGNLQDYSNNGNDVKGILIKIYNAINFFI